VAIREIELHGLPVAVELRGKGPPVLLIHGLAGTMRTWDRVVPRLASHATVIAPDLPGCGRSAPPPGDYSLGGYANGLRDLLDALGHPSATIVGHSLGGGIAMQFAYQFPERCDRLVLVSSGGLGTEVSPLLRVATIPGADLVIGLFAQRAVVSASSAVGRAAGTIGIRPDAEVLEYLRIYSALSDGAARRSLVSTLRGVVDHRGQRVSARNRLYLATGMPSLIIWGRKDRTIPVEHAQRAHEDLPGSRLELFDGAGHFPHVSDPGRFSRVLVDFLATTEPRRAPTAASRRRTARVVPRAVSARRRTVAR
jgi:pimeloyl-ACP methyl ester carboxylesterase